jgi:hypothetical protein
VLDEVPLNPRRIIAREWLIFVACLLVSLGSAVAVARHAPDAAAADAVAAADAAFAVPQRPAPPLSLLNRAGQIPFWKVSMAELLLLYGTVALARSVIWAVTTLRQPAVDGSPDAGAGSGLCGDARWAEGQTKGLNAGEQDGRSPPYE